MLYSVLRLRGERMVVGLVDRWQLNGRHAPVLLRHLQDRFSLPGMLVALDDSTWRTARAYAEFDSERHLFELLAMAAEIEWSEMPTEAAA
jgi:hypothetical protein